MNRNCLVPKIDEIPAIAKISNAAVKSITEMKLDNSNNDSEIFIEGYSITWRDQNRKGGGVIPYVSNRICYNNKGCTSYKIENTFIELYKR